MFVYKNSLFNNNLQYKKECIYSCKAFLIMLPNKRDYTNCCNINIL